MHARVVFAAAVALWMAACGPAGGGGGVGGGTRLAPRSQELIPQAEIAANASEASNALQIIEKLRPQMLRSRGTSSPTDPTGETARPKVYVDNVAYGELSTLTNLNASQIKEIRFVNSRDATTAWGTGHMGGVIHVIMKR